MKQTKILATIGPASNSPEKITEMIQAGLNCVRINIAHGDFVQYASVISNVRSVSSIPILVDIKGPELRVVTKESISVANGTKLTLGFTKEHPAYLTHNVYDAVELGQHIYFDDGAIEAKIIEKHEATIVVEFQNEGVLKANKGVNSPKKDFGLPSLSAKDLEAIEFSKKHNVEFIGLSFVRSKEDVLNLRKLLGNSGIRIISKIESMLGIQNIDEIIEHSDGIMVARGDLGIEIGSEKIPYYQKMMCRKCNQAGKVVIVATQMLESMIVNAKPTRAEVSDVANAILDGADCIMLSGETAVGKHPVEVVKVMTLVAREVEKDVPNRVNTAVQGVGVSEAMSASLYALATGAKVDKVICLTRSGYSAQLVSRFRLQLPIIAVTDNEQVYKQMQLCYGVRPILIKEMPRVRIMYTVTKELMERKLAKPEEMLAYVGAVGTSQERIINALEVHRVDDLLNYHQQ